MHNPAAERESCLTKGNALLPRHMSFFEAGGQRVFAVSDGGFLAYLLAQKNGEYYRFGFAPDSAEAVTGAIADFQRELDAKAAGRSREM